MIKFISQLKWALNIMCISMLVNACMAIAFAVIMPVWYAAFIMFTGVCVNFAILLCICSAVCDVLLDDDPLSKFLDKLLRTYAKR